MMEFAVSNLPAHWLWNSKESWCSCPV